MESACSLEKGPFLTITSAVQRPYRTPSQTSCHLLCNRGYNSSVLSIKCGNASFLTGSAHRQLGFNTNGCSLELATITVNLPEWCCMNGSGRGRGRGRALSTSYSTSPLQGQPVRLTVSPRKCNSELYDRQMCTLGSFKCFSFDLKCSGLLDADLRDSVRLRKTRSSREVAILTMLSRYPRQLDASPAQGLRDIQLGRQMFEFQGRGKRSPHRGYRQVCEASDQEDVGKSVPEDENPESSSDQNPLSVPGQGDDTPRASPPEPEAPESDWRAFRARLVVSEQQSANSEETAKAGSEEAPRIPDALPNRWAHPILAPEAGCVLIATEKIDGQQSFERSVILLLSPGSTNPREGPYGLILNRPLSCRIKDIKPKDRTLVKYFGNCQVHHGGPLDEDMFLLLHGTEGVKGYREVIPGVYYGAASGLEEIMRGRRPLDYRFFFGYSGWSVDQLKKEIDQGLWCVAACSTDLITGHSAAGLWEEILLLMGGKYAELSKRPRRKHF